MPLTKQEIQKINEHIEKFGSFDFSSYEESPTNHSPVQNNNTPSETARSPRPYTDPETWRILLPADHHCFSREAREEIEARAKALYLAEAVKRKGAILSAFTEVELLTESLDPSAIKKVTHRDVTSRYFVDWFFKLEDWVTDTPEEFPYYLITHSEDRHVYGYYNGNQLDAIICVEEYEDCYELSFFCVNQDRQHQGIGQCLFQFVLNRYQDKKLTLDVYKNNTSAIHLYKKYGFKSVGTGYDNGYHPGSPYYIMLRDKML